MENSTEHVIEDKGSGLFIDLKLEMNVVGVSCVF